MIDTMQFGAALALAKIGHRIARDGWNGKGMFVAYMPPVVIPAEKVNERTRRFVPEGDLNVGGYLAGAYDNGSGVTASFDVLYFPHLRHLQVRARVVAEFLGRQLGQQVVHRQRGRLFEFTHQRQPAVRRHHHLEGARLTVAETVLAGMVDVKPVVCVLDHRDAQPPRLERGNQALDQGRLAGAGESGEACDLHVSRSAA